jgi:hypothetical protein
VDTILNPDKPEPNMPRRREGTKKKIPYFLTYTLCLGVFVAGFCFHFA